MAAGLSADHSYPTALSFRDPTDILQRIWHCRRALSLVSRGDLSHGRASATSTIGKLRVSANEGNFAASAVPSPLFSAACLQVCQTGTDTLHLSALFPCSSASYSYYSLKAILPAADDLHRLQTFANRYSIIQSNCVASAEFVASLAALQPWDLVPFLGSCHSDLQNDSQLAASTGCLEHTLQRMDQSMGSSKTPPLATLKKWSQPAWAPDTLSNEAFAAALASQLTDVYGLLKLLAFSHTFCLGSQAITDALWCMMDAQVSLLGAVLSEQHGTPMIKIERQLPDAVSQICLWMVETLLSVLQDLVVGPNMEPQQYKTWLTCWRLMGMLLAVSVVPVATEIAAKGRLSSPYPALCLSLLQWCIFDFLCQFCQCIDNMFRISTSELKPPVYMVTQVINVQS